MFTVCTRDAWGYKYVKSGPPGALRYRNALALACVPLGTRQTRLTHSWPHPSPRAHATDTHHRVTPGLHLLPNVARQTVRLARLGVLAHADRVGRDLDKLTVDDILDGVLEGELHRRRRLRLLIRARRAHVGQLLRLADVDLEVVLLGVDADDLVLVHLVARLGEERATVLHLGDRIRRRRARLEGEHVAAVAAAKVARVRLVARKRRRHHREAARRRHHFALDADHATRGHLVLDGLHALRRR